MILEAKYGRVILWGATVDGRNITAELGYFAPNMINATTVVYAATGGVAYRIKLLNKLLNHSTPAIGHSLVLPILQVVD